MIVNVGASPASLDDPFLTAPTYSIPEAARLAGTSTSTVRRWLRGDESYGRTMRPVFGEPPSWSGERLSFLQLMEVVVVARYRGSRHRGRPLPLSRLRQAHQYAREQLGVQYPFATLDFREEGGHLLFAFDQTVPGQALALDLGGQLTLPIEVRREIEQNWEYGENRLVQRWYPLGSGGPIVVDPHFAAGQPVIVRTRVTVEGIQQRFFVAGESIDFIADDLGITTDETQAALRFAARAA